MPEGRGGGEKPEKQGDGIIPEEQGDGEMLEEEVEQLHEASGMAKTPRSSPGATSASVGVRGG